ncbi:hypothetical protein [Streptomyces sp. NPDC093149]|uniref:hypothetical protein n=1 Tax=Streptomyces sp. NPDC093149 TaxID=3366031 RepID=UPI003814DED1
MHRLLLAEEDAGRLKARLALVASEMVTVNEVLLLYLVDGSVRTLYDDYREREVLAIAATTEKGTDWR